jgi:hypothetical protein
VIENPLFRPFQTQVNASLKCGNSSEKNFLTKRFPRDKARRKEWLIKVKRDNWQPTDNSCLCEVSLYFIFICHLTYGPKVLGKNSPCWIE